MVRAKGLEPSRQKPRILSPLCLPIPSHPPLATPAGFEPATYGLEDRCSYPLSYGVFNIKMEGVTLPIFLVWLLDLGMQLF